MSDDEFGRGGDAAPASPLAGWALAEDASGDVVLELSLEEDWAGEAPVRISLPAEAAVHLARALDRHARRGLNSARLFDS